MSSDMEALLDEDASARRRALDVTTSFLVQAPAGSGKTELLIQRYLALLAGVDDPSQIIALTFTRKAAGEMRERVRCALLEAERDDSVDDFDHARLTRALAKAALQQNQRRGWALTEHPARIRMETFDALATSLARRGPIAAGLGPVPGYVDDAGELYRRAAENAVYSARANDANWKLLVLHLDNQAPNVARLLARMLERRSQWLREVIGVPAATLREELEAALRADIVKVLADTRAAFPAGVATDICECARHVVPVLARDDERRVLASELQACVGAGGIPPATIDARPHWQTLGRFLLVANGASFRKQFDIRQGFEAAGKQSGKEARVERKRAMESLCGRLASVPGLASALKAASQLPEPRISDDAWRIVEALLDILPTVVAELSHVFASERRVDFMQANLAAIDALGEPDTPSELLLQLDASVQHLLVDEFQDTSIVQLELVKRLTAGWSPGDGRTLFVVGDPMQSIYRFRDAEVAFFLDAQQRGRVADIPVERLSLRRNFRSQANVVAWCNTVFDDVLGRVRDPARSIVPFEPAVPHRAACEGIVPTVERCENAADEAAWVVEFIRQAQSAGASDIAVLVRARAHLAAVLPALRRAQIAFVAVELDLLSQRQAVRDLAALTHALLQPADRLAWLAVLRAPWCGLTLHDLIAVTDALGRNRADVLPQILGDVDAIAGVSDEGRARMRRALAVLGPALDSRGRASVVDRVRGAWLALGGPACLDEALDLDTATLFFDLLAKHERGGDVPDWQAFVSALGSLHASPAASKAGGVQVMTMHKAKGLEFDTVIVTGLAHKLQNYDNELLRYRRRDAGLIIAPAKSRGGSIDPVYEYLARLECEEDDAELGRLLYVACTRAKTRLHLVAAPGTQVDQSTGALSWKDPPSGTSLAKLTRALPAELAFNAPPRYATSSNRLEPPELRRLGLDASLADPDEAIVVKQPNQQLDPVAPSFDWARETTRRIGTLAHRVLARIADEGLAAWPVQRIDALEARVRADLASLGFTGDELPSASARVLEAVRRTLDDPRGRWLFENHYDAKSEWAIAGVDAGAIVHGVVDRTFVVDGTRWIVDFKTGSHEGGDVAAFLDNEVERYRSQLARYGRLLAGLDNRPVRLALYYPLLEGGFREVPP